MQHHQNNEIKGMAYTRNLQQQSSYESIQSRSIQSTGRGSPEPISKPEFDKLSYGKFSSMPKYTATESLLGWMGPNTPAMAQDAIRRLISFRESGQQPFKIDLPRMRTRLPMFNRAASDVGGFVGPRSLSADWSLRPRIHDTASDLDRSGPRVEDQYGMVATTTPGYFSQYHSVRTPHKSAANITSRNHAPPAV